MINSFELRNSVDESFVGGVVASRVALELRTKLGSFD